MKVIISSIIFFTVVLLASCGQGSKEEPIVNRDPNGTSELQLTMRNMYDYFDQVKKDIAAGKSIDEIEKFEHLLTDTPTEEGKNQTEIYKAMAQNYLVAVDQLNQDKDKAAFTQVVNTCMSCHEQVCPGPMVRIKKLYAGLQ